jgi:hypothetical protein
MTATDEVPLLVRSFPVGKFVCTLSFRRPVRGQVQWWTVAWEPDVPKPGQVGSKEKRQYLAGRDAAIAEFVKITGMNTLVVDL